VEKLLELTIVMFVMTVMAAVDGNVNMNRGYVKMGHVKMGHVKMGHVEIGHMKIGHVEIGHVKIGHVKMIIESVSVMTVTVIEAHIKLLHWKMEVHESVVEVFGWILVLVREALPDHLRRVQELAVCHESIQFMVAPTEHREV
jgi:hypothetical protein